MAVSVDVYRNNNVKLAASHVFMVLIYIAIILAFYLLDRIYGGFADGMKYILTVFLSFSAFHGALAIGAYLKIELSRRVSEFVFAIMLLGFPVGTFLAIYLFLPACVWVAPDVEA